jgi:hypothetical protein
MICRQTSNAYCRIINNSEGVPAAEVFCNTDKYQFEEHVCRISKIQEGFLCKARDGNRHDQGTVTANCLDRWYAALEWR